MLQWTPTRKKMKKMKKYRIVREINLLTERTVYYIEVEKRYLWFFKKWSRDVGAHDSVCSLTLKGIRRKLRVIADTSPLVFTLKEVIK